MKQPHLFLCGFTLWLSIWTSVTAKSATSNIGWKTVEARAIGSDPFHSLARHVHARFEELSVGEITKALSRLATAQMTFKGLDGAAHEAYQRTHSADEITTAVSGRAQRSASRLAATAQALFACELVEMVNHPELNSTELESRFEVLLNSTDEAVDVELGGTNMSVLLLLDQSYDGGAGLHHGSIFSLSERVASKPRGRLLIAIGDSLSQDLGKVLKLLDTKPERIRLKSGLVSHEVASVQPALYQAAGKLLEVLEPHLRTHNSSAVHFVGRSLSGGVAALAAAMLDGSVPMPKTKLKRRKKVTSKVEADSRIAVDDNGNSTNTSAPQPLGGLGRARSSATTLGAPPCLSSNVLGAFCTSILYGDDIVSRATQESVERLCGRIRRDVNGGFVGRNLGWMSDTVSLTVSSLQSHGHGSEGEELRLAVPGRAFLVRPRRLGGMCSIHEVGNLNKGGREALRANLLWQLHDVLLSKSMWRHNKLEQYIHGLDRVQLRGANDAT